MRTPILKILIPYIFIIIFLENRIISKENLLLSIAIIFIIFLIIFYNKKKIKFNLIYIINIILVFNLINKYELIFFDEYISLPKREVILLVKVNKRIKVNKRLLYVATLVKNVSCGELLNENLFLDFRKKFNKDFIGRDITIRGIKKTEYENGYLNTRILRCDVISSDNSNSRDKTLGIVKEYIKKTFERSSKTNPFLPHFQNAIFLGESNSIPLEIINKFQNSGTLHLFAVSGLHIGLLYIIINFVFSFFLNRRFHIEILIAIILYLYLSIVEFPPSAVRAYLMVITWQCSKIIYKKRNSLSSLFLSCLVVLIIDPNLLMSLSFQLSYTVVLAIIAFHCMVTKSIKFRNKTFNLFISSLFTTYAAFCGSLLLIFDNFQIIVPGSIFINIITIPFIFFSQIFIILNLFSNVIVDFNSLNIIINFLFNSVLFTLDTLSFENITYFKIENIVELNNLVHIFYVYSFFIYRFETKLYVSILLFIFIPISLLLLFIQYI